MARTVWRILLGLVAATLAYGATRAWQESTVGTGPVITDTAPDGPTREIAFVANAVGGTITLIDIAERTVVGQFSILPDGPRVGFFRDPLQWIGQPVAEQNGLNYAQDTDLSPDGRVLYVARGFLADVAAFDVATGALMWRTPVGGFRADHMTISPNGRHLFVSALTDDQVEVIDTTTGRHSGAFATGIFPHDIHVTADGRRVYNASLGDMTTELAERDQAADAYVLTIADADTLAVEDRHMVTNGIRPFQITADETRLYGQLSNTHAVFSYDLEARREIGRIDLPVAAGVTEDDWDFEAPHHGLALTPDETTLCVAGRASDYAGLVAARDLELLATVPVGDAPSWSSLSADGRLCVLANTRSDDVSIVSLASRSEVARLPAGRGPKHITVGQVPVSVLERLDPAR